MNGAVFQMFAHGIMTGLFFALVGLVYEKAHSREIFKMGGFATMMPGIAAAFTIGGLSSLGLPATAGFVAEFLTFLGAWASAHSWWLFPGVIGAFLTSLYVLRVVRADLLGTEERRPALPAPAGRAGHRVGRAGAPGGRDRAVRRGAQPCDRRRLTRDGAAAVRLGGAVMTRPHDESSGPLALEAGSSACCWLVLVLGCSRGCGRADGSPAGWRWSDSSALSVASLAIEPGRTALRRHVRRRRSWRSSRSGCSWSRRRSACWPRWPAGDASFARRSAGVPRRAAGVAARACSCSRRRASSILLFVAFELMSIPLYFLTGFQKRDDAAPEGALKFFLVGSVSSAVMLYGLSFVYGATGTHGRCPRFPRRSRPAIRCSLLGLGLVLAGLGFKIAAVPFHMWVPDTYEAAGTPFVAWLSVAPKAAGFVAIFRLYLEGVGAAALIWVPVVAALAGVTIVAGNLMAIPQQNIKRLLAYSGIAHIGYLLMGLAAMSVVRRRDGAVLSGGVPVRQHGRVLRRAGGGARRSSRDRSTPTAGWRAARRCWR